MRTNPISVRLGYSRSWEHKILPGRSYGQQSVFVNHTLQSLLTGFFDNPSIKAHLLVSQIKCQLLTNRRYVVNVYVYFHRHVEALSFSTRNRVRPFLPKFILAGYAQLFVKRLGFLLDPVLDHKVNFILVRSRFFRAQLVSNYIISKLANRFKLAKIIPLLGKSLVFYQKNQGLRVECSGRFDRKERASRAIYHYGRVNITALKNRVYYHQKQVTLKYGVCGIKVWLLKK